jgi:putative hemolysin
MLGAVTLEVVTLLLLILANGAFAMTEIAMLSARRTRLRRMAEEGSAGAAKALELLEEPNRFLSTVQVGITLVGIVAGAISGATIGRVLGDALAAIPFFAPYADALGIAVIVTVITYLSLLIGELVPKRLALRNAEGIAVTMAPLMVLLSSAATPLVRLLSLSTEFLIRLMGMGDREAGGITEEDVRLMIEEGARAGVFEAAERDITRRVFRLDDIRVSLIMTPYTDLVWLDVEDPLADNWRRIAESDHSYYPVCEGTLDRVRGIAAVKHIWANTLDRVDDPLLASLQEPLYVPENTPALRLLETFREAGNKRALVIDEFGSLAGIVTLNDLMEAIAGDIQEADEPPPPTITRREDGSWLVDARLPADQLTEVLGVAMPGEERGEYDTVGGFAMSRLGRIPHESDTFEEGDLRFEVVDMDGHRVDKLLVTPVGENAAPDGGD